MTWKEFLESEHQKPDSKEMYKKLIKENVNEMIVPPMDLWYAPFRYSQPKDVKLIMIGHAPDKDVKTADGLAFSSIHPKHKSYEMELFHKWLKIHYGDNESTNYDNYSTSVWAQQDVLLLNATITYNVSRDKGHWDLWRTFLIRAVYQVLLENPNVVIAVFSYFAKLIAKPAIQMYKADHNADISYLDFDYLISKEITSLEHDKVPFRVINNQLILKQQTPVIWHLKKEVKKLA